jgi:hypothetical protein
MVAEEVTHTHAHAHTALVISVDVFKLLWLNEFSKNVNLCPPPSLFTLRRGSSLNSIHHGSKKPSTSHSTPNPNAMTTEELGEGSEMAGLIRNTPFHSGWRTGVKPL